MTIHAHLEKLFSLDGKVAVVTGSGQGLGWGIADLLAKAGATVAINDLDPKTVDRRVGQITDQGLKATPLPFDVTDHAAARTAIDSLADRHGSVDIVVNNAGIQNRKPIVDYLPHEWDALQQTHVGGTFNVTQAAARHMIAGGRGGRIVNLGSIATLSSRVPMAAYAAAKGALTAVTHALASELGRHGITCNALEPGFMATEFTKSLTENEEFSAFVRTRVPAGRWGTPDDIAPAVLYLTSPAASYVNGTILRIDGGTLSYL
ncbi:SDR family NAD(P)-dependent oxidoreductase [Acuticoccus kandeliae]|uniref:SDR family NAD(P)-dependent oxidoreductase n=1 Tax=Acuticoccus kandeliae TaxID=2073160 RepID=UPI0013008F0D|nr:glucose 1-dehydrogenase [Acuticoccus kandeliae]